MIERSYKTGRKFFIDEFGKVKSIECSVCHEVKSADDFQNRSRDDQTGKNHSAKNVIVNERKRTTKKIKAL